ncbi:hypothetical protein TWF788_011276 [Orbilia oligospora]|uniref:Uncharacterized protein n=1 Tax=Orbilia oligospora TaxID=2813651 RepID=A0A7C8Q1Q2_ORBOL|nr:hypothetical protein TWF788_011276 [Orbilia oligospora]
MSIFGAITTFAAASLTNALLDSSAKQNAPPPAHEQQPQQPQQRRQTNSSGSGHSHPKKSILPQKEAATAASSRIIELSPSPPLRPIRSKKCTSAKITTNNNTTSATTPQTQLSESRTVRPVIMQPAGLPQNSIWTTMSYPIPRGPCLQKSSLISACSCQRFMVHPLKATTSFDCDGCSHHASFHKMKSHEEEVENAARFRESLLTVESSVGNRDVRDAGSGRRTVGLIQGRVELEEEEGDDDTVDEDGEFLEPEKKRRAVAAGKKVVTSRTTSARGGKRKRIGEQVLIAD